MAMHIGSAPGFTQMLNDGARYYSGLDETVCRSIEACRELTRIVSTSYGPKGKKRHPFFLVHSPWLVEVARLLMVDFLYHSRP